MCIVKDNGLLFDYVYTTVQGFKCFPYDIKQ